MSEPANGIEWLCVHPAYAAGLITLGLVLLYVFGTILKRDIGGGPFRVLPLSLWAFFFCVVAAILHHEGASVGEILVTDCILLAAQLVPFAGFVLAVHFVCGRLPQ